MAAATTSTTSILLMLLVTFHGSGGARAQAPGPAPEGAGSQDCFSELLTMSDCLTYVEEGSNLTKPDKPCCPELATLVNNNPICLCYLLDKNTTSSYGIEIDLNRALNLPTICKVDTPPPSACALVLGPAESPTESPSESPTANSPQGTNPGSTTGASSTATKSVMGMAPFVGLAVAFLPTFF